MKVLVSDAFSPEGLEQLRKNVEVDYQPEIKPDELVEKIKQFNALVVRSRTKVTADVIEAGENLKVIGRAGVGVDNIDVDKATEKGIIVVNAPHGNTISAAEHAIALLTSLARNIADANRSVKQGEWKRSEYTGVELNQKTFGVVGIGRIGSEVARRARAMGMKIITHDPYISAEQAQKMGVEMVPFEDLLKQADFITLHVPMSTSTYHLIGEKEIAMMKPGGRIVNCARGGLIDEDALCKGLQEGKVAGAALDVFEQEPPGSCNLLEFDNVICTPHLGALTREAQTNVALQVSEQVINALQEKQVVSAVNVPALHPETSTAVGPYLPLLKIIGSFYFQVYGGSVDEIELTYSGDIASLPFSPMTTSCLVGFLQHIVGDSVNWVNAPYIAKSRGIAVREIATTEVKNYSNMVTMSVRSGSEEHVISATRINSDMRIVRVDDYRTEIVPSRYMLLITCKDQPRIVGKVGTLLGEDNINIASMQLGRKKAGGTAAMALQTDEEIPLETLKKVRDLDVIKTANFVVLPKSLFAKNQ